jgi:hypothetical protein
MRCPNKAISFLVLVATGLCSAQMRQEVEPYCNQHSTTRTEITDADSTILGVSINHASLKDVQAKLGSANVIRISDAEESDIAVCYVSPDDGTVLAFYSGALGGWEDITYFVLLSPRAGFAHGSQCTPSNQVSRNLSTESGLRLGVTEEQAKVVAGNPTSSGRTFLKYDYICRQKMTEEEVRKLKTENNWDATSDPYFDRVSRIRIRFTNSTASRVEVGKEESY